MIIINPVLWYLVSVLLITHIALLLFRKSYYPKYNYHIPLVLLIIFIVDKFYIF